MPQPPYPPDFAPCDSFLFGKLTHKSTFATIEEIKTRRAQVHLKKRISELFQNLQTSTDKSFISKRYYTDIVLRIPESKECRFLTILKLLKIA